MLRSSQRAPDAHLFRFEAGAAPQKERKISAIGALFGTQPALEEGHDKREHRIRVAHDPASARP